MRWLVCHVIGSPDPVALPAYAAKGNEGANAQCGVEWPNVCSVNSRNAQHEVEWLIFVSNTPMQTRMAQWDSKDPTPVQAAKRECLLSNARTRTSSCASFTNSSRFILLPTFPTLQYCTAVSFDICNAIARFPGQFECHTHARVGIPPGFMKPLPWPAETPTLGSGYGFAWVRVWVALENPRVTHDNHYKWMIAFMCLLSRPSMT